MVIRALRPFYYEGEWLRDQTLSVPNDAAQRLINSGDAIPASIPPTPPPLHTPAVPLTNLTVSGLY